MLLVGSVFLDHPRSKKWYEIQMRYLKNTTKDFFHVVYLNGKNNFYEKSKVLKVTNNSVPGYAKSHGEGLNCIVDYFNKNHEFDKLLIIDSDCFPIQKNWLEKLSKTMDYTGKSFSNLPDGFHVASVVRYENFDSFAHPSVFFVRKKMMNLKFDTFERKSFIGNVFYDISSNVEVFYPLIRSNRVNRSPILCGIYWDAFYHHGSGSRFPHFRSSDYLCFEDPSDFFEQKLFDELVDNPNKFISSICRFPISNEILQPFFL